MRTIACAPSHARVCMRMRMPACTFQFQTKSAALIGLRKAYHALTAFLCMIELIRRLYETIVIVNERNRQRLFIVRYYTLCAYEAAADPPCDACSPLGNAGGIYPLLCPLSLTSDTGKLRQSTVRPRTIEVKYPFRKTFSILQPMRGLLSTRASRRISGFVTIYRSLRRFPHLHQITRLPCGTVGSSSILR
jgi:hypothetical protein